LNNFLASFFFILVNSFWVFFGFCRFELRQSNIFVLVQTEKDYRRRNLSLFQVTTLKLSKKVKSFQKNNFFVVA